MRFFLGALGVILVIWLGSTLFGGPGGIGDATGPDGQGAQQEEDVGNDANGLDGLNDSKQSGGEEGQVAQDIGVDFNDFYQRWNSLADGPWVIEDGFVVNPSPIDDRGTEYHYHDFEDGITLNLGVRDGRVVFASLYITFSHLRKIGSDRSDIWPAALTLVSTVMDRDYPTPAEAEQFLNEAGLTREKLLRPRTLDGLDIYGEHNVTAKDGRPLRFVVSQDDYDLSLYISFYPPLQK